MSARRPKRSIDVPPARASARRGRRLLGPATVVGLVLAVLLGTVLATPALADETAVTGPPAAASGPGPGSGASEDAGSPAVSDPTPPAATAPPTETPVEGESLPPDPAPPATVDPAPDPAPPVATTPDPAPPAAATPPAPADPAPPATGAGSGHDKGAGDDRARPAQPKPAPAPAGPVGSDPAEAPAPAAPTSAPVVTAPAAHGARPMPVAAASAASAAPLVLAPPVAPFGPARGTGGLPRDSAGTAAARPAAARALFAAGASAGLLPFAGRTDGAGGRARPAPFDLRLGAAVAARLRTAVTTAGGRPGGARHPAPAPAHHGGGSAPPAPPSPIGPPGNAGAGGVAGAAGGAASAVWCALLAGTLVLLLQELRRHRCRLVVPAPRGVAFSLQRPG